MHTASRFLDLFVVLLIVSLGLRVFFDSVRDSAALVFFVGLVPHLCENVLVGANRNDVPFRLVGSYGLIESLIASFLEVFITKRTIHIRGDV